jgi:hypothetical protein
MCWSRKGVPGSKRSGEAGTAFLGPGAEPLRERAGSRVVVWVVRLSRTTQTTTPDEHEGRLGGCSAVSGRSRIIAPEAAVQHPCWAKALRGARDAVQPQPRWPACEATAYRRSPAPAPGATQLALSGVRDARFAGKQKRAEVPAGRVVFILCGRQRNPSLDARCRSESSRATPSLYPPG